MTAFELDKEMMKLRYERDNELEDIRKQEALLTRNMRDVERAIDDIRSQRIRLDGKVRAIKDKRQELLDARKDINARYTDRKLELMEQFSPSEQEAEEWKYAEPGEEVKSEK
jgi:chromosome segregation ATPase